MSRGLNIVSIDFSLEAILTDNTPLDMPHYVRHSARSLSSTVSYPSTSAFMSPRLPAIAVIRFKLAHMARETEALQAWIEVDPPIPHFIRLSLIPPVSHIPTLITQPLRCRSSHRRSNRSTQSTFRYRVAKCR